MQINKKEWKHLDKNSLEKLASEIFHYYRKRGFPYYQYSLKEKQEEVKSLREKNYSLLIQDKIIKQTMHGLGLCWSYFPHMWEIRCKNFRTPMEVFQNDILFLKAINKRFTIGDNISDAGIRKILKIFSGTHAVSNFRPTAAGAIYNHFGKGIVWDMSSGFGGRLLGALTEPKVEKYIGTDPSIKTYEGLLKMKEELADEKPVELYKVGSEDFLPEKNSIDLCFTSPPYFDTEKYSDEPTQSYIKFPSPSDWLEGFLRKTIKNCYYGLKNQGILILNVNNVKTYLELEQDIKKIAKEESFQFHDELKLTLSSLDTWKKRKGYKYEKVLIWIKD